jgi:CheY-like chemotaxis protein
VLLSGCVCQIVGGELPLAADLADYLSHAGARVVQLQKVAELGVVDVREPETMIWLLLPDVVEVGREALRLRAAKSAGPLHVVTFRFGDESGFTSKDDLEVSLDLNTLTRRSLVREVARAAGLLPASEPELLLSKSIQHVQPITVLGNRAARVLVAEDIETNREVIRRQLKLLGLGAEMTLNGQQALERWRSGEFDLVLTDVRMPIMDGYDLARAIRAEEKGMRRTTIIALTASALPEKEALCIAAGMDGVLVKPLTTARLKAIIERYCIGGHPALVTESLPDSSGAVSLDVLKSLIGDDPVGIDAVLEKFRDNSSQLGDELESAIGTHSWEAVEDIAHKLKSGAFSIGAKRLGEICVDMEHAAASGKHDLTGALLPELKWQMRAVQEFIDSKMR